VLHRKAMKQGAGHKRLRVEVLAAAAAFPVPPPVLDWLPDPKLTALVAEDLLHLLALGPTTELYLHDEVALPLHPMLTRVWCPKGHRGQHPLQMPGTTDKRYDFGTVNCGTERSPGPWLKTPARCLSLGDCAGS
jgi:hypothetical protein